MAKDLVESLSSRHVRILTFSTKNEIRLEYHQRRGTKCPCERDGYALALPADNF